MATIFSCCFPHFTKAHKKQDDLSVTEKTCLAKTAQVYTDLMSSAPKLKDHGCYDTPAAPQIISRRRAESAEQEAPVAGGDPLAENGSPLFMSSDASSSVDLHYSSDSEDSRTPAPLPPTADDTFEKHPELYEGLDQLFFLKPPQKNPDITFLIETPRPAKYTVRTWNFRKNEVSLVYLDSLKGTALDLPKSRPLPVHRTKY
jgi:hypothetical protein